MHDPINSRLWVPVRAIGDVRNGIRSQLFLLYISKMSVDTFEKTLVSHGGIVTKINGTQAFL